jgi:hypothetical protein
MPLYEYRCTLGGETIESLEKVGGDRRSGEFEGDSPAGGQSTSDRPLQAGEKPG